MGDFAGKYVGCFLGQIKTGERWEVMEEKDV